MEKIQMVDLRSQYLRLKQEIDSAIDAVLLDGSFIQGPQVKSFTGNLSRYLDDSFVITCGNGTDGLQLAMMALGLKPGDEVIIPAFTYVATAEVIGLLGLTPVLADVDPRTFNLDPASAESRITRRTRAIVPVHLFGQCADMSALLQLSESAAIPLIEDAAQSLGSSCTTSDGRVRKSGTIGKLGVTSFFPTKTLGCYGDGGAVFTEDKELANVVSMIANHGQSSKYVHERIGINSRLDTVQASVLDVKLKHIEDFTARRRRVASHYDAVLAGVDGIEIPLRNPKSTHVFHQYTLLARDRDRLKDRLAEKGIPSMIYYPQPLHFQKAYAKYGTGAGSFVVSEKLSKSVISLPIHTEMQDDQIEFITAEIRKFYND